MELKIDIAKALSGLIDAQEKVIHGLEIYGDTAAKKLEAKAKHDAPWKDRTGNARNTMRGESSLDGNKLVIAITGNQPYSPDLEYGRGGKYAILNPTIKVLSPEIIEGLAVTLRNLS